MVFLKKAVTRSSDILLTVSFLAYRTLWPKNMPGVENPIVEAEMLNRRKLAVHSPVEFHCQMSNMTTIMFGITRDPERARLLQQYRLLHQNQAIILLKEQLENLQEPLSEALLQRVTLLDVSGGEPLPNWDVHIHPESPILVGTNRTSYYRFRGAGGSQGLGGKVKLWRWMTQMLGGIHAISAGLARRLQV